VMEAVVRGLMNKQIAYELGISEVTVKLHRGNVMRKMEVRSVAELVRKAEVLGDGVRAPVS
ncbi:response regulator transcription factor, partial [Rhizobium tibeticum]|uniref:response regulator transcription factor n=1 Tax=Rhizobium tibeticum TaxID=501024 RepID=UPI0027D805DE